MRSLLREIIPPVLLRVVQRLWQRSRGLGWTTFEGCYSDFSVTPANGGKYDDADIARSVVAGATSALQNVSAPKPLIDDSGQLILPLVVSEFVGGPLTVLDFGAGPARGLINIFSHARGSDFSALRYFIIETPAVCRALEGMLKQAVAERVANPPSIEISADIPNELSSPLIVNAGSAIQYISDYRETLSRLARLRAEVMIISQVPVSDQPTYARLQLNIPNKKIAQWVFNRGEFQAEMTALGYTLSFVIEHDLRLTHRNAPAPVNMSSMVFRPSMSGATQEGGRSYSGQSAF
jgi:putative methyltransferase (TIGR04325 family)